mgnify:CR=1 FL=1
MKNGKSEHSALTSLQKSRNVVIHLMQLAFNCISYYYRYINYFEKHVAYLIS